MMFSDSITVSDGTDNHTFNFVNSYKEGKSTVMRWKEDTADNSQVSELLVKYDPSNPTRLRSVLQRRASHLLNDGVTLDTMTMNFSINHHIEHDITDVVAEMTLLAAAEAVTGAANKMAAQS